MAKLTKAMLAVWRSIAEQVDWSAVQPDPSLGKVLCDALNAGVSAFQATELTQEQVTELNAIPGKVADLDKALTDAQAQAWKVYRTAMLVLPDDPLEWQTGASKLESDRALALANAQTDCDAKKAMHDAKRKELESAKTTAAIDAFLKSIGASDSQVSEVVTAGRNARTTLSGLQQVRTLPSEYKYTVTLHVPTCDMCVKPDDGPPYYLATLPSDVTLTTESGLRNFVHRMYLASNAGSDMHAGFNAAVVSYKAGRLRPKKDIPYSTNTGVSPVDRDQWALLVPPERLAVWNGEHSVTPESTPESTQV